MRFQGGHAGGAPERTVDRSEPSSSCAGEPTDRLKVCVVGSGTRFVSGISYYTYFLARALQVRYDVAVILMRHLIPTRWYPGRQRVGHDVMAYDIADEVPTFDGVDWWGLPSVPRALFFLRSQQPDVLILHWWSVSVLPWYLLLAWQARRRGSIVVVELHEDLDSGEARLPLIGRLARRGLKALCRQATALVVHSAWDRDRMSVSLGISAHQLRVIPHGPYPIFATAECDAADRQRPHSLQDRSEQPSSSRGRSQLTVLYFGTIRPYKGLEHLVEAFEQIRRNSDFLWKLLVVGETWEGWTLPLELIESSSYRDDIELVNRYVTDHEAAGFFRRADIVALPYLRSSASGPLAITQAFGLPVVVSAVGGLVEATAAYTGGVLVPAGDPDELVRGLLAASELRGRKHASPVTWDAVAESYAELFAAAAPRTPATS
ncbi:MAG: glycosyltransferase family 4 protein [Solirubrobacteraceae bacterium]